MQEDRMQDITFALIKPDAVAAGHSGEIISMIEHNGFDIIRMQKGMIDIAMAERFYAVHAERPFFKELITFITSGPVVIMALRKANAVQEWRNLMGATDPLKAEAGTVRKRFGTNISNNAVHGSDAVETAHQELALFFGGEE